MKQDTLERLLIDGDMGVLSADVQELLSTYLQEHSEAASLANSIHETTALAEQALKDTKELELPAFQAERFEQYRPRLSTVVESPRQRHWWIRPVPLWQASFAACLAIFIGAFLFSRFQSSATPLAPGSPSILATVKDTPPPEPPIYLTDTSGWRSGVN